MNFNNRQNTPYEVSNGKIVWESRSVAVNGVIIASIKDKFDDVFILVNKRGPASADFQGYMNLVAGYLDWDETGTGAFIRECWEEVGLNVLKMFHNPDNKILRHDLDQPWKVVTDPNQNRQNVTLRYGLVVEVPSVEDLPKLSLENNEVEGEAEDPMWMPLSHFGSYTKWAFNHDQVIIEYLNDTIMKGLVKLTKD